MSSETKCQKIFEKYKAKSSPVLTSEGDAKHIYDQLSRGKNSYMRIDRVNSTAFDYEWIDTIEGVIFDLGDIIANPRQNTKTTSDIVPVELARKTNSESIQHLASHTQFIKEITDTGDVIPNKILTIGHDDDLVTYENRFIATFVRKLVLFIEKRYEYISSFAPLADEEVLYFKNESFVNGSEVEIETKIKVKTEKQDDSGHKNKEFLERLMKIREYVLYFYNSAFMKILKNEKDVRNPILQTNIIRKNLKYHHCYEVYKFVEKYDKMGVSYRINENYSLFNDEELKDLNETLMVNYLTIKSGHEALHKKENTRVYKAKVLTSMDDESFVYGPLLEGPVKFIRVDEDYQKYLDSKVKKDLPLHPTKQEREYYKAEYAAKRENRQDLIEKEKLINRKTKEDIKWQELVEKIVHSREEEQLTLEQYRELQMRLEEERILNEIREEIRNSAFDLKKDDTPEERNAIKPWVEQPIVPNEDSVTVYKRRQGKKIVNTIYIDDDDDIIKELGEFSYIPEEEGNRKRYKKGSLENYKRPTLDELLEGIYGEPKEESKLTKLAKESSDKIGRINEFDDEESASDEDKAVRYTRPTVVDLLNGVKVREDDGKPSHDFTKSGLPTEEGLTYQVNDTENETFSTKYLKEPVAYVKPTKVEPKKEESKKEVPIELVDELIDQEIIDEFDAAFEEERQMQEGDRNIESKFNVNVLEVGDDEVIEEHTDPHEDNDEEIRNKLHAAFEDKVPEDVANKKSGWNYQRPTLDELLSEIYGYPYKKADEPKRFKGPAANITKPTLNDVLNGVNRGEFKSKPVANKPQNTKPGNIIFSRPSFDELLNGGKPTNTSDIGGNSKRDRNGGNIRFSKPTLEDVLNGAEIKEIISEDNTPKIIEVAQNAAPKRNSVKLKRPTLDEIINGVEDEPKKDNVHEA